LDPSFAAKPGEGIFPSERGGGPLDTPAVPLARRRFGALHDVSSAAAENSVLVAGRPRVGFYIFGNIFILFIYIFIYIYYSEINVSNADRFFPHWSPVKTPGPPERGGGSTCQVRCVMLVSYVLFMIFI